MIGVFAVGLASIIVIGCILAEAYDRAARKYGWPR